MPTTTNNKEPKFIYAFGGDKADGNAAMRNLLGGKGANLAEMVNLGIPVPPGFTITTEVCTYYYNHNQHYPPELEGQLQSALRQLEERLGAKFGDKKNPLLLSVRSGARASMPGMMDTVLNLGMNDETAKILFDLSGDERFAYDSYRRFVQMYGDVVLGLKPETKHDIDPFEEILEAKKHKRGVKFDSELTVDDMKELVVEFKAAVKSRTGHPFPDDPMEQLRGAIGAVFGSWMNDRAQTYRELNGIPAAWGTAVNVQSMVFGNRADSSGTGVAFTRDPATGENVFYGEYLFNAQGEDVVAGVRTPIPISELQKDDARLYDELNAIRLKLENHFKDMMDIEFTIQLGKLWILQARVGKRTGFAAIKIAVDMVREGLITKNEAILRIDPNQLNQLLRPVFDIKEKKKAIDNNRLLATGLNAGPGAACGKVVFNAHDAVEWTARGEKVILVRIETSPEDIKGLNVCDGILTARGGMTSHAALVARQMGKVCVAGCGNLLIDYKKAQMAIEGHSIIIKEGDIISIDGTTGEVIAGEIKSKPSDILQVLISKEMKPEDSEIYKTYRDLMKWADETRKLHVRTNADQPEQAANAVAFGAEGIGLCRTEHMFFKEDRIRYIQKMILAENDTDRQKALDSLLPLQKQDFFEIFKVMNGLPVIIRTLDPPLHEFLPNEADAPVAAKYLGISMEDLEHKMETLHEANPMLGLRGCRLGILHPAITKMQVQAIIEAAMDAEEQGYKTHPEIMIPLVTHVNELQIQADVVNEIAEEIFIKRGRRIKVHIGTMIELPRAALTAGEIAKVANFFSFGTNDLTQTTFGISRDDSAGFLPYYIDKKILPADPFQTIDRSGVGRLIEIATAAGRAVRKNLEIGICGEHGGDPESVEFCHMTGLDYVSCSPFRVPIARLAAARAALHHLR
ncbi:MAG: pyruvate, phosphate dikinase [Spirochaetia bacterium]|nr:pyruvate, phosphate dikinase [Spirochaetia bacterium]